VIENAFLTVDVSTRPVSVKETSLPGRTIVDPFGGVAAETRNGMVENSNEKMDGKWLPYRSRAPVSTVTL
jgi:hypothetical protein